MLKNKKIIFLLIVCFLLFLSSNVFAFTFDYNEETYTLPDLPSEITEDTHYIITYNSKGYFCLYYTNDSDFDKFVAQGNVYNIFNKSGSTCNRYLVEIVDGSSWGNVKSWGDLSPISQNTVYYATDNVFNSDGTIFFQVPPPAKGVIQEKVEEIQLEMVTQEEIVILPLILVVVVSLVGLRKALQMLLKLLRRCLIT